jgi:hypothetical protein
MASPFLFHIKVVRTNHNIRHPGEGRGKAFF